MGGEFILHVRELNIICDQRLDSGGFRLYPQILIAVKKFSTYSVT